MIFEPAFSAASKLKKLSRPVTCIEPLPPASVATGADSSLCLTAYSTAASSHSASRLPEISSIRISTITPMRCISPVSFAFTACNIVSAALRSDSLRKRRYHAVRPIDADTHCTSANSTALSSLRTPARSGSTNSFKRVS